MKTTIYYPNESYEKVFIEACKWQGVMYEKLTDQVIDNETVSTYKVIYETEADLIILGMKMQLEFGATYQPKKA